MRCKVFNFPVGSETALDRERKVNEFLEATTVKHLFASIANSLEGPTWSVLFFYEGGEEAAPKPAASAAPRPEATVPAPGAPLTREQFKLIVALKKWRADQAASEGVPLYMVAQNKWLEEIVQLPGRAPEDLARVRGLGEWRVQKYGSKILEVLNAAATAGRAWPSSARSANRA